MTGKGTLKVVGRLWLGMDEQNLLGDNRIALLEKIEEFGSITRAARAIKMSYKAAWDAVDTMNNASGVPLVESISGGKGGGGTRLTEQGIKLVEAYRLIQREHEKFLAAVGVGIENFEHFYQLMRRLTMKTSARNQFFGKVDFLRNGPVNAEVTISLSGDDMIYAVITHESVETLDLKAGDEVWALVKAPWVMITEDDPRLKLSARNRLCGTVTRLTPGAVNTDVVIMLNGNNTVSALITNESAENLNLREGARACAVFKASSVILGISA